MTLTIAAEPHPEYSPPRMKLTVTSTVTTASVLVDIYRIHEDGSTWRVITEDGVRLNSMASVFDYHAPYGVPVQYIAQTSIESASATDAVYLDATAAWLVPSDEPSLAVSPAYVARLGDELYTPRVGVFDILDGLSVSVSEDGDSKLTSTVELAVDRSTGLMALRVLASRGAPVLLNIPYKLGRDVTWRWIMATAITKSNPGTPDQWLGQTGYLWRNFTLTYTAIAAPDVVLVPTWTSQEAGDYWSSLSVTSAGLGTYYATAVDFGTDTRLI